MNTKGFTLIEVMIATGLFVVLMVFGVAAILNTNVLFKKNQAQRAVLDNMSFIAEEMMRSIRVGRSFRCITGSINQDYTAGVMEIPDSCYPAGSRAFAFEGQSGQSGVAGDQIVYLIDESGMYKDTFGGQFLPSNLANAPKITDSRIRFDTLQSGFHVIGAEAGDEQQPIVVVRLVGRITDSQTGTVTPFAYQFSATQRGTDS